MAPEPSDVLNFSAEPETFPASARRVWSREEYDRAARMGLFQPEERLELIGGEVIRKVSPQDALHATAVSLAAEELRRAFTGDAHVRVQLPLALGAHSEPEPDVAVIRGSVRAYRNAHPREALLVVEVSDTTLTFDQRTKASLYARSGVPEYWIVNLPDRVLEIRRDPAPASDQPFGHAYKTVSRQGELESVSPAASPRSVVAVRDLLP